MLRLSAAAMAVFLLAMPATSQKAPCFDTLGLYEDLSEKYGESRQVSGFDADRLLTEMWANEETGTWTLLVTNPEGRSCIVKVGGFFEKDYAADPAGYRL